MTEYPEAGHDCLIQSLMQEGLFDWLLAQRATI